jgi:acyl carrier protein
MTQQDILEKIQSGLTELVRIPKENITLEKRLKEDFNMDSMFMVEMVMRLESDFKIEVPEADMPQLLTVEQVVTYVSQKISEKA